MHEEDDNVECQDNEEDDSIEDYENEEKIPAPGPFAVLVRTLDFLNTAWDHAVSKDDFEKMIMVVDKTLDVNDRYMAVHMTQEDNNERINPGGPEQFGFSAEINNRERPPDVKSR